MVVYKITAGDYIYIGSTSRTLKKRIQEHNYRLSDPEPHRHLIKSSKLYNTLREQGITKIDETNCEVIDEDGGLLREQEEIDAVPKERLLNSYRAYY